MAESLNKADKTKTLVSVIIVSWNGKKFVRECLESLFSECKSTSLEVILVDNASTDGTPDLVEKEFPAVKVIKEKRNHGFAKANNIGMRLCHGEYVCLVNSDVKFVENCFEPMVEFMIETSGCGDDWPQDAEADRARFTINHAFPYCLEHILSWHWSGRIFQTFACFCRPINVRF